MKYSFDEIMMKRCLQLALKGIGNTYPNPLVGSIITNNNKIIGEGFHYKAGLPHAEIIAINSVKNKSLLNESTLYVNLEPCSHFGKTPPCSNAIIKHKIKRVVIGCTDYSSKVNGKGIERLKENGVEVLVNCLEKEATAINKRFFTFQIKKRPYIILKWASSADGFLGKVNEQISISNKYAKQFSHKLRTDNPSILVGKNTVLIDDPRLTAREYYGNNPVRIIIDKNLLINENKEIYNNDSKTIIFNNIKSEEVKNIQFIKIDFSLENYLQQILNSLYTIQIQSIIIEGGAFTLNSFIQNNLWDEAYVFKANELIISDGIKSPTLKNELLINKINLGNNILFKYQNKG
ncbi:MAG: bifunctional diaminohydroxyphosphoribosylaminopyrimidine deaminase/5-amino-6-(5-phosphoribosylamino)uracil reductase RibD [Solirubrobacteraceae bacterium]